ncbi:DHA2 family efflux MFS transporter permease subunit [Nocardioides insulae]|uniref:DHA2 family efflux MFS transporter permease subunit n=1 Tax=Nocardioides insulae TaxID=394734 RepID=UPI0003F75F81|nr:DHA2 family efflux MFS transporter permease subunit [Nocardioides insulae]
MTADAARSASTLPTSVRARTPVVVRLLVLATFVVILNETIMINAIPRLITDLGVTESAAQWVSTAFMLTMAAVIPVTGWFLHRVTTRTAYATAMMVFSLGTAVAGLAPTFEFLLVGRIIQAAGTAVMMPLLMTTLMTLVPERDRGRVMGNVAMAISVAPALGPTVSGLILQVGSWRLLFAAVLPIALLVTWGGLRRLENVGEPEVSQIDWLSVILAASGFGGLVFGLSRFETGEIGAAGGIVAAGVLLIAAFVARQLWLQRRGAPLLDLRTLTHPTYAKGLALLSVAFMTMIGTVILLPLYLQSVRGLTPLQTGMLVMPGGLLMGLLGPTVGRVYDRLGARILIVPGSVGVVAATLLLAQVSMTSPYWLVLSAHLLLMVSMAGLFTPVFTLTLGDLPQPLYSHGSSMLGTLQQVAAAFGTALMMTVMVSRANVLEDAGATRATAQLGGMQTAFLVAAGLALVLIVLALLMPNRTRRGSEAEDPSSEEEVECAQP